MNIFVELKTVKLTKSKIKQMDYIGIPKNPNAQILGWVNMDNYRWVIVNSNGYFYRTEFITKIEKEVKCVQFPLNGYEYEYPELLHIKYDTYNKGSVSHFPKRDNEKNIELYEHLITFKKNTEIAGQVYY